MLRFSDFTFIKNNEMETKASIVCVKCLKEYGDKITRILHQKSCSEYFCQFCRKKFKSSHSRSNHYKNFHVPDNEAVVASETNTNGRLLWHFLQALINDSTQKYSGVIAWKFKEAGVFKILDPSGLAKLWGIEKNNISMNFGKMRHSLLYYCRNKILEKVQGELQCYKFLRDPSALKMQRQTQHQQQHQQHQHSINITPSQSPKLHQQPGATLSPATVVSSGRSTPTNTHIGNIIEEMHDDVENGERIPFWRTFTKRQEDIIYEQTGFTVTELENSKDYIKINLSAVNHDHDDKIKEIMLLKLYCKSSAGKNLLCPFCKVKTPDNPLKHYKTFHSFIFRRGCVFCDMPLEMHDFGLYNSHITYYHPNELMGK